MTSSEFIIWLKGFTEGVHEFNITPKQWDLLKDKLAKVDDNTVPIGGVITDYNTFRTVYPNWTGINPYGTRGPETLTGTTITTTPGTTGTITIANPNLFTTSTATSLPSGSTIRYTNSTDKTLLND
jgi:hypothetical protein